MDTDTPQLNIYVYTHWFLQEIAYLLAVLHWNHSSTSYDTQIRTHRADNKHKA